jgi:hypothetical protein
MSKDDLVDVTLQEALSFCQKQGSKLVTVAMNMQSVAMGFIIPQDLWQWCWDEQSEKYVLFRVLRNRHLG